MDLVNKQWTKLEKQLIIRKGGSISLVDVVVMGVGGITFSCWSCCCYGGWGYYFLLLLLLLWGVGCYFRNWEFCILFRFLNMLEFIVQEPDTSFKKLLPNIITFGLDNVLPVLNEVCICCDTSYLYWTRYVCVVILPPCIQRGMYLLWYFLPVLNEVCICCDTSYLYWTRYVSVVILPTCIERGMYLLWYFLPVLNEVCICCDTSYLYWTRYVSVVILPTCIERGMYLLWYFLPVLNEVCKCGDTCNDIFDFFPGDQDLVDVISNWEDIKI